MLHAPLLPSVSQPEQMMTAETNGISVIMTVMIMTVKGAGLEIISLCAVTI